MVAVRWCGERWRLDVMCQKEVLAAEEGVDARNIRWERAMRLAREAGECAVVASGSERPGNRSLSIGRGETGGGVVGAVIGLVSHTATRHVGVWRGG